MAANYCLPRKYAPAFLKALKDGTLNPIKLADMTSAERRTAFEPIVGAENAQEVNALFESKLLLKNKQQGFITWARKVGGLTEEAKRDLLSRVSRMPEGLLNPATERQFLADLAEQKLGVSVTADETKQIFNLAKTAQDLRASAKVAATPEEWTKYGRAKIALTEYIESLKPNQRTWGQFGLEVANIPRSALSTLDLSAPLAQGWGLEASGNWIDSVRNMMDFFKDEENYQNLRGWIAGHPDYEIIEKSGLSLTELGAKLSKREEAIQSTLVETAWQKALTDTLGVPNLVRASNRAFTGFLNYARFKTMTDWIDAARATGEEPTEEMLHDFARTINNFSGRGQIADPRLDTYLTPLNAIFFAPRKTIGTINMFTNPNTYLRGSKMARIKAVKMLLGAMAYTGAAIGLAKVIGYDVDLDPRSTNFLKIRSGDTSIDITGGNGTYLRFLARMATNQVVTSAGEVQNEGEGYRASGRAGILFDFLRNKLAPTAAFLMDALYGRDPVGRPFNLSDEARDKLMPMTMNDYLDYTMKDGGNLPALVFTPIAMLGGSLQTIDPSIRRAKRDVWGDPLGTPHDGDLDRALNRIGLQFQLPPHKIRGVDLTDQQYDEYQQILGRSMRQALTRAIHIPGFDRMPLGVQEKTLRETVNGSGGNANASVRSQAANQILAKYPDIARQALVLQRQRLQQGSAAAQKRRAAQ